MLLILKESIYMQTCLGNKYVRQSIIHILLKRVGVV